ncbi:hypothetical protein BU14_0099s0016 [Porphyra umbilicalis]|uniref:SAM domain-containing protein n=1 Tax=Porphyra umbilicalis TaxID=2786 RepID=A0A1X6PDD2_PORUM|nr:hypothetical protein BU14_0099s0016 [Porphyra umbilicalis]|eukprot:OSX78750.1 hypothetical protein BU14_0099s0016 [Porphyra umbilicalis]
MNSGSSHDSVGDPKGGVGMVQLPALDTPSEVVAWVSDLGFPEYAPAFLDHAVSGVILRSLTTEDLRDELGVKPLRHRRALIAAIDHLNSEETAGTPHAGLVTGTFSALPEFGRMLTHMSNVRTVHSWQRLAVQQLILAAGVVRLALVELKEEKDVLYRFVLAACSAFCGACVLFAVYGGWRFLKVTSILDSDKRASSKFYPDLAGVIFSQLILHFVAACIITMICVQVFFTLPAVIA